MLKKQAAMGPPAPNYLAYDAAHAKECMQGYWVRLHKKPDTGKAVYGLRVDEGMIAGETTLSPDAAWRLVFDKVVRAAKVKSVEDNPTGKLPQMVLKAGDETVGFYDLQGTPAFLAEHPNKLVWVWDLDVPNYPIGQQTNENTVILILGHPSTNWDYTPLASIYTPQHCEGGIDARAPNPGGTWSPMMQALQAQAPDNHPVKRLYHDVHKHSANINTLIRPVHAAVHQQ